MKKFAGWMTRDLQDVASLIAGREMMARPLLEELYEELIREIRNRRVKEELFQMKLKVTEEE